MIVKLVEEKDLNQIVNLCHRDDFKYCDGSYPEINYLKELYKQGTIFAVYDEEKVIGCLVAEFLVANGCLIWYFVVEGKHRGKGVGTSLIKNFEAALKVAGITWTYLISGNHNLSFYSKLGYKTTQRPILEFAKSL